MLIDELKKDRNYDLLISHADTLGYADVKSPQSLECSRSINHFNSGNGYETVIAGASYAYNGNYDLQITKKFCKQLLAGKYSLELYDRLYDDIMYYDMLYPVVPVIMYLWSDVLLLKSFGLVQQLGDVYIVSNLENNDTLMITKEDIIFNDALYLFLTYSAGSVFAPVYVIFIIFSIYILFVFCVLCCFVFYIDSS